MLLLSTLLLSCSKKDDATPASTTGTCSYQLDGRTVSGYARVTTANLTTGSSTTNLLYFLLSDTQQHQTNSQEVQLTFQKDSSQPTSAYLLTQITYNNSTQPAVIYANNVTTLKETSTGVFAGTFSGTATSGSKITAGTFADARL